MIINERDSKKERILNVSGAIMTAARTAPKGKGIDIIEIVTLTGDSLLKLSDEMVKISDESGLKFFIRDAGNVIQADAVIILGTKKQSQGLNCGYCGFPSCEENKKHNTVPCEINSVDLGIAIGSACSMAADMRVDSRVMFSVGKAALRLNILPDCTEAFGIVISCSSKNPFFDRKSPEIAK